MRLLRRSVLSAGVLVVGLTGVAAGESYEVGNPHGETDSHHSVNAGGLSLQGLGDLDGDGMGDVVSVRGADRRVGTKYEMTIEVRSGINGKPLWTVRRTGDYGVLPYVLSTRVGPAGRPGVVVVQDNDHGTVFEGLDSQGHRAWRHVSGRYLRGVIDGPGRSDGLLLEAGGPRQWLERLDTARGRLVDLLPVAQQPTDGTSMSPVKTGDLDGDGGEDLALTYVGDSPGVETRSGATGRVLWRTTETPLSAPQVVGNVVPSAAGGRAAHDILYTRQLQDPLSGLPGGLTAKRYEAVVVDGTTGRVVWTHEVPSVRSRALPVHLAGSPAVPAVALWTVSSASDGTTLTSRVLITAYDMQGRVLWEKDERASVPDAHDTGYPQSYGQVTPSADFDGDGSRDARLEIRASSGGREDTRGFLFYTRSGVPLRDQYRDPLYAGTTRKGVDLVDFSVDKAKIPTVLVVDGATMRLRFETSLVTSPRQIFLHATGAHLRGPCADALIVGSKGDSGYLADVASNGQLRWSVRLNVRDPRPATAILPRTAPRPRC